MSRRLKTDEPIEIILPTASFLDMVFQLFAFFIITYSPSSLEGQVQLALPSSGVPRAESPETADPTVIPDKDAELKTELVVFIKANHAAGDGTIGAITVEDAAGVGREVKADLDKDPELGTLRDYLKQTQTGLTNKDAIKIKAESALKHAFVIKVMDACAQAGFTSIGFAPPPDYKGAN
jgi:biopolymer transport protein ExbD